MAKNYYNNMSIERREEQHEGVGEIHPVESQINNIDREIVQLQMQHKQIMQDYQREVLQLLGIVKKEPLSEKAEDIYKFAKQERVDPKWLFQTLNGLALYLLKSNGRRSYTEEKIELPNDDLRLGENYELKRVLSNMRLGSYDDRSSVPDAEKIAQEQQLRTEEFEYRYGLRERPRRESIIFKWLRLNAHAFSIIRERGWDEKHFQAK